MRIDLLGDVSQVLMYYILYSPFAQSISSILITGCEFCVTQRLLALAKMEGRNEMDPPLCGSTAMSHNEFTIRELM